MLVLYQFSLQRDLHKWRRAVGMYPDSQNPSRPVFMMSTISGIPDLTLVYLTDRNLFLGSWDTLGAVSVFIRKYRGTSPIRKRSPPWTITGPYA